ncbi:MAG: FtsX-like permease family protein, partial [Pseudomonadales bacterium]|nr:FtsX-like permease family protein [Pseudomonadales bacterium]
SGITLFTEKLQGALVSESKVFLAADLVVQSPDYPEPEWLEKAAFFDLHTAITATFPSMVFAGEDMYLSSVKAVSSAYPLRGDVELLASGGVVENAVSGPASGQAWVDLRLLNLLSISIGDEIHVGEKAFTVSHSLQKEPDAGGSFSSFAPRVIIPFDDLAATAVVMPGSRVEYRLLLAGALEDIQEYRYWLKPHLQKKHRLLDLEESQPAISRSLDRAKSFMLLSGSLGVVLASLAIAMASRRYFVRHQDVIAIMKTLGAKPASIGQMIIVQLLIIAVLGILPGYVVGYLSHFGFLWLLSDLLPASLPSAGWKPYLSGGLTGLLCVMAFALPPFWQLKSVLPLRVLRRDMAIHQQNGFFRFLPLEVLTGGSAIFVLMLIYAGDLKMALLVFAGILAAVVVAAILAFLLFALVRTLRHRGASLRLALSNLKRQKQQTLLQLVIFGLSFMLLVIAVLIRTSLIAEWKLQLPASTPNYFLINIADHQIPALNSMLAEKSVLTAGIYPMVRGRLTHINGIEATTIISEDVDELYRELNLTWSDKLLADNVLEEGDWWAAGESGNEVSIEQRLAQRLGVKPGDRLTFTIAEQQIDVVISSVRSLHWERMQPNFYFIFPPGVIDRFPASYITSFYLPKKDRLFINQLIHAFPTVTFFEIDQLIERVQSIVEKVTAAVEWVLWLVLVSAALVLMASVQASMDRRLHEGAILRAMGASRKLLLGGLIIEFLIIGGLSGLLAASGGEITAYLLQTRVFNMAYQAHWWVFAVTPVFGMLVIAGLGVLRASRVVSVSPLTVLREVG